MKKVCVAADVPEGQARGFDLDGDGEQDVFVVHHQGQFFAYRNSCPHNGAPLNWVPDQFLDPENHLIQCQNHDALFRIDDGVCVGGPCAGASLQALKVQVDGDEVLLDEV